MMSKQVIFFLFTLLLLGLFASAAPIPVEGTVTKKSLKQLKLKRGDSSPFMKRDDGPKPSGYPYKRDEADTPKPSKAYKRDEPSYPKPSKYAVVSTDIISRVADEHNTGLTRELTPTIPNPPKLTGGLELNTTAHQMVAQSGVLL